MATNSVTDSDIARTLGLDHSTAGTRRVKLGWVLAILSLAALGGTLYWRTTLDNASVAYITEIARRGTLTATVTATGTLQPTNQVEVGSELSGIVATVDVDYNEAVKVGQVLATLNTDKLKAERLQYQAALESAQAKVQEAKASVLETRLKFDRCKKLVQRQLCTQEDADTAQAAYARAQAAEAIARAQVAEAQATLDAKQTDLGKAVIRSPIDGIVLARNVEPGQTVAASFQAPVLFTLAEDLTQMQLHVDVDEADVGQVQVGQNAVFTVDAYPERNFPAQIAQVRYAAQTVGGVVTYETVLNVDNSDLRLRPGMTATAEITVKQVENALLVPNAALRFVPPLPTKQTSSGGSLIGNLLLPHPPRSGAKNGEVASSDPRQQRVWRLQDGQPVPVPVTIGLSDGMVTEVQDGALEPGTALVVDMSDSGQ